MKQPNRKGNANGIDYQLQFRGLYYSLRFTDPRTHERQRIPTKKATLVDARNFAVKHLNNYVPGETGRLTVGDLVENFLAHQQAEFPDHNKKARAAWDRRMKDKFAHIDARDLRGRDILNYLHWCIGIDYKNGWPKIERSLAKATANRDVAVISGAYTHAQEMDDFNYRPRFAKFEEDNAREGFLYQYEFDAICAVVSGMGPEFLWLRALTHFLYDCGNRRGEAQKLKVEACNFIRRTVRLKALETKTKEGRFVPMTAELYQLLKACCEGKKATDYVFTRKRWNKTERKWAIRPIGDFRKLWRSIVAKAGIERDILIHDFRRSAVSNMIERGVERDMVRAISGHKTDSMLTRYNIGRESKAIAAVSKIEEGKKRERELAAAAIGPPAGHDSKPDPVLEPTEVVVN